MDLALMKKKNSKLQIIMMILKFSTNHFMEPFKSWYLKEKFEALEECLEI